MRQPITPDELLTYWQLTRLAYLKKLQGLDNGVERSVLEVMDFQLNKCIQELQQVLHGEYPVEDLLKIIAERGPAVD